MVSKLENEEVFAMAHSRVPLDRTINVRTIIQMVERRQDELRAAAISMREAGENRMKAEIASCVQRLEMLLAAETRRVDQAAINTSAERSVNQATVLGKRRLMAVCTVRFPAFMLFV